MNQKISVTPPQKLLRDIIIVSKIEVDTCVMIFKNSDYETVIYVQFRRKSLFQLSYFICFLLVSESRSLFCHILQYMYSIYSIMVYDL